METIGSLSLTGGLNVNTHISHEHFCLLWTVKILCIYTPNGVIIDKHGSLALISSKTVPPSLNVPNRNARGFTHSAYCCFLIYSKHHYVLKYTWYSFIGNTNYFL